MKSYLLVLPVKLVIRETRQSSVASLKSRILTDIIDEMVLLMILSKAFLCKRELSYIYLARWRKLSKNVTFERPPVGKTRYGIARYNGDYIAV